MQKHGGEPGSTCAWLRIRQSSDLTALPEEYASVPSCLRDPVLLAGGTKTPNTYAWQLGLIDAPRYASAFRVVVGRGTPTTTFGTLAAIHAIELFDPRYIAFVGIASGFDRDGQRQGDVAISSVVVAYEYGKLDTGGFVPRGAFTCTAATKPWCVPLRL